MKKKKKKNCLVGASALNDIVQFLTKLSIEKLINPFIDLTNA